MTMYELDQLVDLAMDLIRCYGVSSEVVLTIFDAVGDDASAAAYVTTSVAYELGEAGQKDRVLQWVNEIDAYAQNHRSA